MFALFLFIVVYVTLCCIRYESKTLVVTTSVRSASPPAMSQEEMFEIDDREWRAANAELLAYINSQIAEVEAVEDTQAAPTGLNAPTGWDFVEGLTTWDGYCSVLSRYSIRQLKAIAKDVHLKGYSSLTKSQLVSALG